MERGRGGKRVILRCKSLTMPPQPDDQADVNGDESC